METGISKKGVQLAAAALFAVLTLSGCGNNGYPYPPGNGYYTAGMCGGAGGQPVRSDGQPYYSMLSGGAPNDSISLSLFYVTARNPDNITQNITGTAGINLAELSQGMMSQYGGTGGFCASSTNGGGISPGIMYPDNSVSLVLNGVAQVAGQVVTPLGPQMPSPYGSGYGPAVPMPVTVSIGQVPGCSAASGNCPPCGALQQGRLVGCVFVTFQGGGGFQFTAQ